jgi:hypothetical protein
MSQKFSQHSFPGTFYYQALKVLTSLLLFRVSHLLKGDKEYVCNVQFNDLFRV